MKKSKVEKELADTKSKLLSARLVLLQCEFAGSLKFDGSDYCPVCRNFQREGHKAGCDMAAALKE